MFLVVLRFSLHGVHSEQSEVHNHIAVVQIRTNQLCHSAINDEDINYHSENSLNDKMKQVKSAHTGIIRGKM